MEKQTYRQMKAIKSEGGISIAVYDDKIKAVQILLKQNKVNYIAKAGYNEDSDLDILIKSIINKE
ncbi:hypothetical protein [Helicobacter sp. 12S02232-10]|uniref:hypothetical protein n=1 Tax=Helicobacter sp. 12S02232-10 TaxID=1476197 RepID=UPI0015DD5B5D|nr:hypothetical protein [Helicobacter sp. 12S02232-10]